MGIHATDIGPVFRWNQRRQERDGSQGSTVLCTYEVPLTPDGVRHVETCEEYGAILDIVLMGLDMTHIREID